MKSSLLVRGAFRALVYSTTIAWANDKATSQKLRGIAVLRGVPTSPRAASSASSSSAPRDLRKHQSTPQEPLPFVSHPLERSSRPSFDAPLPLASSFPYAILDPIHSVLSRSLRLHRLYGRLRTTSSAALATADPRCMGTARRGLWIGLNGWWRGAHAPAFRRRSHPHTGSGGYSLVGGAIGAPSDPDFRWRQPSLWTRRAEPRVEACQFSFQCAFHQSNPFKNRRFQWLHFVFHQSARFNLLFSTNPCSRVKLTASLGDPDLVDSAFPPIIIALSSFPPIRYL